MTDQSAPTEVDLGSLRDYASTALHQLVRRLGDRIHQDDGFRNEVFELRPYYWGDCTCGFEDQEDQPAESRQMQGHKTDCLVIAPNFRCGDIEIRWYKHIGRGMNGSRLLTYAELEEAFHRCHQSI
jgi:hypothetical protein